MRFRPLLFWCCAALCLSPLPAHAAKHALLIGIADYSSSGYVSLDGTINDIELVRRMLKDKFNFSDSEIRLLKNSEASHTGIQQAFADLARQVKKDDIVYIHFSGHGSLTPDQSGEKKPMCVGCTAYDSTWVSFGSRVQGEVQPKQDDGGIDLNKFDILDDEIGEWLIPIYAKTDNIVFVSDSCHSGNMTRGNAPKVRGITADLRPHPLGKRKFAHPKEIGAIVGAAREDQWAAEYEAPDSKSYGLFTWNWVQALVQTRPGDTWEDAFKRTVIMIGNVRDTQQHPQIIGKVKRAVFGGDFPPTVQSISVGDVSGDGKNVILKAGRFAGITIGSIYKKKGSAEDTFEITAVQQFSSDGAVKRGSFIKGYFAVEETHVYPYSPLKVFVRADLPQDNGLTDKLKATVAGIPGYEVTVTQRDSNFMLLVIRPKRQGGEFVKTRKEETLPQTDPGAKPQIWVLNPDEQLTGEKLQLRPDTEKRALELVTENLRKMSRVRELKKLGVTDNGGTPPVELYVSQYTPDPKCGGGMPDCLTVPERGKYGRVALMSSLNMQDATVNRGDILTFHIKNNAANDLYCYLLDITINGKIAAIFPGSQDSSSSVLVPAGKEQDFSDLSGLEIEDPGQDTVKLIASQMQLDVTLFEQGEYRTRGKGSENPLENYLSRTMGNATRGPISTGMKRSRWGTVMFSFEGK